MVEISIIVPVYNVEKSLERCVKTILAQTFDEFELILVNDGSTDKSGEICDKFASLDERVSVIHQENKGVSAARNTGIVVAQGKYIGFVDSDDWIDDDMFETLYNLITQHNADIAECSFIKTSDFTDIDIIQPNAKIKELVGDEKMVALYSAECFGAIVIWNKLYNARLFQNIMFQEGKCFEDQIITPQLFFEANKVISTNYIGYYYFQNQESFMHSKFTLKKLEALEAYKMTRKFLIEKQLFEVLEHHDATYAFLLLKYIKLLKETRLDRGGLRQWKKEFDRLLIKFIKNSQLNFKSKIVLLIRRIQCCIG